MSGRLPGLALLAILVALVLPAASSPLPSKAGAPRAFAAACGAPACINLDVSQGDMPDPVPAGDTLVYRITLQNHGPDTAPAVFLIDVIPANSECLNVTTNVDPVPGPGTPTCNPDGGKCALVTGSETFPGDTIVCNFGPVENTDLNPKPGPRVITVTLRSVVPGALDEMPDDPYPRTITNRVAAEDRGDSSDSNPDNNLSLENTVVTSPGDLRLSKSHPDDPVPPTATFEYLLSIDNIASAPTLDPTHPTNPQNPITLTDTLPHGFQFEGTNDPETDQCSATAAGPQENSIVTCHPQVSIPGASGGTPGNYTIHLLVNARQTGTFTNVASVTKAGGDVTPGDDSASDLTHVACPTPGGERREPFLCVFKTDSQDPVPQGQQFSYAIKIQNQRTGPNDAFTEPVTITDQIPAGMTVVSTAGASCPPVSGGTLTCTLNMNAEIPPGGSKTLTVNVVPLLVGTFENVACINQVVGESERQTCANQPTTIIGAADLMITKTGGPTPVQVNSPLTYTIKVTNNGPSGVEHVQMNDSIPANVDFVSSDPAIGSGCELTTPAQFHCDLGFMAAATSKTVTIVVKPTLPGTLTNTATVANDGTPQAPVDFNLANNTATFSTDAVAADLAITKTASPTTPIGVGTPLTFTLKVTNKGPGEASGIVVTDQLPGNVSSPVTTTTKGSCTGTATVTCNIATMALDEVVTITIKVTPGAPGTLTNTARVESTGSFDTDTSNNQASAKATVTAADVMITKTASPEPVAVGTALTYTLTVTNNGPSKATGVTVSDTLPDAVSLPVATPSQGTCFGSPTVTCSLGDLAPTLAATVTIVVTPLAGSGSITNSASVSSAFDLNSTNNAASATTTVIDPKLVASPDLGAPGFVPSATGTDFPPNAPLTLHWQPGLGTQTVTADASGSFKVSMLIFPNDQIGPRLLTATALDTTNPVTAFLPTSTDFLVVPPTAQPFQVKPQVAITKIVSRGG